MSRTNKDKPYKFTEPSIEQELAWSWSGFRLLNRRGVKRKKRKEKDVEYHWMTTPGWWVRIFMNRPKRHKGRIWERNLQKIVNLEELEDIDAPDVCKKPHIYYW